MRKERKIAVKKELVKEHDVFFRGKLLKHVCIHHKVNFVLIVI